MSADPIQFDETAAKFKAAIEDDTGTAGSGVDRRVCTVSRRSETAAGKQSSACKGVI